MMFSEHRVYTRCDKDVLVLVFLSIQDLRTERHYPQKIVLKQFPELTDGVKVS